MDTSKVTVAGPSHARRYRHAIATGQIARPRRSVNWMDLAAASMLHPDFLSASSAGQPEPTLCMVPDFRLGNRSLRDPDDVESYLRVEKKLISAENDRRMMTRVMERVKLIRDKNPDARFVFWCLGWREFNNRTLGNHSIDGDYRHPYWNLDSVESDIGDSVISLQGIMDHRIAPMLHIDGSGHPSYLGLELFRRMTDTPDVPVTEHLDVIADTATRPVIVLPRDAVLTGDSFWLEALAMYAEKGLIRIDPRVEMRTPEQLLSHPASDRPRALFISKLDSVPADASPTSISKSTQVIHDVMDKEYRPTVFVWEARARIAGNSRSRFPRADVRSPHAVNAALVSEGLQGKVIAEPPGMTDLIRPRDVEVSHPRGQMPTLEGILTVIRAVGGVVRLEPLPAP